MLNIQNNNKMRYTQLNTQRATLRSIASAVTFVTALMLALGCFLVMPTTQLFAADAPVESTTCVSTDDTTQPVDVSIDGIDGIDANEPSCTITLATEDLVVVANPNSPIVINEPNMPQLMLQVFMPLASR